MVAARHEFAASKQRLTTVDWEQKLKKTYVFFFFGLGIDLLGVWLNGGGKGWIYEASLT